VHRHAAALAVFTGWIAALGALGGVVFVPFVLLSLWYIALAFLGPTRTAHAPDRRPATGAGRFRE
jgi:hypothetical protein